MRWEKLVYNYDRGGKGYYEFGVYRSKKKSGIDFAQLAYINKKAYSLHGKKFYQPFIILYAKSNVWHEPGKELKMKIACCEKP